MDYEDQLERALEEKPDIAAKDNRFEVPEPNLRTEGNVTVFENYQAVLEEIGRSAEHLLKYLQDEFGTSAQIDDRGRARLTGEFSASRMQEKVDAYVDHFVVCPECGLPDTHLTREQGAELLECDACGARSSV
jgi:translation initiation factor 2 subunit 2